MESYDLNTRLPPRKRLLAGSMKDSSDCRFPMSAAPVSSDLYARLRDLFNSASASQEEMVEASRAAALAAAEVAARARAVAVEKAAVAAAARAAARSALELLDSVARKRARRERFVPKNKGKKKHVAVKHLYTNKQEVERRLQDESSMCNGASRVLHGVDAKSINPESKDKSEENVVVHSKLARGVKDRGTKKMKGKRKRLLVSQCGIKDQGKTVTEPPTEEPTLDSARPSGGDEVPMKISSVFNCKKFKVPLHSSDSKIAHTLFSDASAPKASIMVKVD